MTIDEWDKQDFIMVWSIHAEPDDDGMDAYGRTPLDFAAPPGAPDGVHTIYLKGVAPSRLSYCSGAVIRNGAFDPKSTEAAAFIAVCANYGINPFEVRVSGKLDHVYIEGFQWDAERGMLELTVGS